MTCLTLAHRRFGLLLATTTALVLGTEMAQADTRPFKATIQITETVEPNVSPTIHPSCPLFDPPNLSFGLKGNIAGTGSATRLGRIKTTSVDCIIPTSADGSSFAAFSTQSVMTGANGDQLFAFYTATLTVSTATGVGALTGQFFITGGTGAFQGASGAGTLEGVEVIQFSSQFSGTGQGRVVLTGTLTTLE